MTTLELMVLLLSLTLFFQWRMKKTLEKVSKLSYREFDVYVRSKALSLRTNSLIESNAPLKEWEIVRKEFRINKALIEL